MSDRAQLAALGARCGSPRCPLTTEEQLARVTAERDALRGALVALTVAEDAHDGARDGGETWTNLAAAWEYALDVLARTGGDR